MGMCFGMVMMRIGSGHVKMRMSINEEEGILMRS